MCTSGARGHARSDVAGPAQRSAAGRTARDVVAALVVLLIPVALVVAVYRLRGGEGVVVVDPAPAIELARAADEFPVAVPSGLTDHWRPVSAAFRRETSGAVLRIGYLTPSGGAVQLVESSEPTATLMTRELGDRIRSTDSVVIESVTWQSFEIASGEVALVHAGDGRTLIVIGQAEPAELWQLAAALA